MLKKKKEKLKLESLNEIPSVVRVNVVIGSLLDEEIAGRGNFCSRATKIRGRE